METSFPGSLYFPSLERIKERKNGEPENEFPPSVPLTLELGLSHTAQFRKEGLRDEALARKHPQLAEDRSCRDSL